MAQVKWLVQRKGKDINSRLWYVKYTCLQFLEWTTKIIEIEYNLQNNR